MRVEGTSQIISPIDRTIDQHGLVPRCISSRLSSMASPVKAANRLTQALFYPFRFLYAYFFPESHSCYFPPLTKTSSRSNNETALKEELEKHFGAEQEVVYYMRRPFNRGEQVLLLDQFDRLLNRFREMQRYNPGTVAGRIRFDHGCSQHMDLSDEASLERARNDYIRIIGNLNLEDLQFVIETTYTFSSRFGDMSEKERHTILVDTSDGMKFK